MKRRLILICIAICVVTAAPGRFHEAHADWEGVDVSVVEKYANEAGRPARKSLVDIGEGDLPLLMFLLAGTVGGFACGYYYRKLFGENRKEEADKND